MRQGSNQSHASRWAAGAVLAAVVGVAGSTASADLTLNLRANPTQASGVSVSGNGTIVTLSSLQPVTLDIFATVTGADAAKPEGFGGLFAGFQFTPAASNATAGTIAATVTPTTGSGASTVWGYDAYPDPSRNGTVQAGGTRIGPDPSVAASHLSPTGWFFPAYQATDSLTGAISTIDYTGDNAVANGQEFKIGTLTFTPSTLGSGQGTATISAFRRNRPEADILPAVWVQDLDNSLADKGVKTPPLAGQSGVPDYLIGSSVRIDVGTATILRGDVNNDGSINALDINPFVSALLNGQAGFAAEYPTGSFANADVNADTNVNALDINPFVSLLLGGGGAAPTSAEMALLASVPEPTCLGLLAVSTVALARRRRTN